MVEHKSLATTDWGVGEGEHGLALYGPIHASQEVHPSWLLFFTSPSQSSQNGPSRLINAIIFSMGKLTNVIAIAYPVCSSLCAGWGLTFLQGCES